MQPTPPPLSSYGESWTPGPVTDEDPLPAGPVAALSAVLNLPDTVAKTGDPLPPLWHWLHVLHWPAQRELGTDGHPLNGHFLPPVPHRQRMWAGGRCEITEPLRLVEPAERVSSLSSVTASSARSPNDWWPAAPLRRSRRPAHRHPPGGATRHRRSDVEVTFAGTGRRKVNGP